VIVIGIDNGKKGAIAVIDNSGALSLADMPTAKGTLHRDVLHIAKGNKTEDYRPAAILEIIDTVLAIDSNCHVIIEEPPLFFRGPSGAKSITSLHRGTGILHCLFSLRNIVPYQVMATSWKSHFGLIQKAVKGGSKLSSDEKSARAKAAAVARASQYYSVDWPTADHAEAFLIAQFYLESRACEKLRRRIHDGKPIC